MEMNKYIDHTLLKVDATISQIDQLIEEAKKYHFASVCISPCFVKYAKEALQGTDVKVCTVIGFPSGQNTSLVKGYETSDAIKNGADEIDMVINIGALKDERYEEVLNDIQEVVKNANGRLVKVILETCLLTNDQIVTACQLAKEAKADFVKTSTGFSLAGATLESVKLMADTVGDCLKVKASGRIRDFKTVIAMIESGASRIGTSNGVKIVEENK